MEQFRKSLKKRLIFLVSLNCIMVLLIVLTGIFVDKTGDNIDEFIRGFRTGIYIAVQLPILIFVIKYIQAFRNEQKIKKLYIEENDERTKFIRDKIGGLGFLFTVAIIAVATVIAGFLNYTVFFTLLAVTFFMVSVRASLKLYYRSKY